MTLKTLLDDVAADATRDLRIDLAQVRGRALERRREVRRRAASVMATAVAVAATIALAVILLPGTSPRAVSPAATPEGGLPDRWFYSPPWTPPVTRHPMPAASMVLVGNLTTDLAWNTISGPVLVSADGRQYASLPWNEHSGQVSLSRDGRRVAWASRDGGRPTLHRIELATGKEQTTELAGNQDVTQLVWAGDQLWATRAFGSPLASVWRWPANGAPVKVCDCENGPLAVDANGRILQPAPAKIPGVATAADLGEVQIDGPSYSGVESGKAVVSPDGLRTARVRYEDVGTDDELKTWLWIDGPGGRQIEVTGGDGKIEAQALAWAPGGIVVRIATGAGRSLRLYDPAGSMGRIVSRPHETSLSVVAVADDVVGTGERVTGVPPRFSQTDRSHVRFLIGVGWSAFGGWIRALAFALVLLAAGIVWWRYGRGRKTDVRDEPAHAPGGPDPAGDGG